MLTHAKTTRGHTSKSAPNTVSDNKENTDAASQKADNRAQAIAQRKIQEMADGSNQVSQLKTLQQMADNSLQAKQAIQLKAMAGAVVQRYPPNGLKVHDHFETRMGQYSISKATVDDIVLNGTSYTDTGMPGATIYYKGGKAVVYDGSQLKTCYPGRVKKRWVKN